MWIEDLRHDAGHALRTFRRNPGFAGIAILTLALGIGATTGIFSVVNAVLLRPLPYADPDGLVHLITNVPAVSPDSQPRRAIGSITVGQLLALRSASRSLSHIGVYGPSLMTFSGGDVTVRLEGMRIESPIAQMLGVPPLLGRLFDANDDRTGADLILLSFATWRSVFGGDPNILGRRLALDAKPYTVVGVMPATFAFPTQQTQFWILHRSFAAGAGMTAVPPQRIAGAGLARLADGVSLRAAAAEVDGILRGVPGGPPGATYDLGREQDELVAPVRSALVVLMVAVAFVLLIACVNVTNLLLARTAARERELAVRVALGAGRGRIVRHLLTESVMLAFAGAVAGVVLARGGIEVLKALATTMSRFDLGNTLSFPRAAEIDIDTSVLVLTAIVSTVAGVILGLTPAIRHSRARSLEFLRGGAASAASGFSIRGGGHRARALLIVAEIAMAVMLFVGGGLLVHSFVKLASVHPGYDATDVLTFQVALPFDRYPAARVKAFADDLVARTRQVPGVQSVAFARQLPMVVLVDNLSFSRAPRSPQSPQLDEQVARLRADVRVVSENYLDVMRIPVVRGRSFNESDRAGQPRSVLINETMARTAFAGQDPIGQFLKPTRDGVPWEIVGVVRDVRQFALDREPGPQFFADFRQWPEDAIPLFPLGPYYLVRTSGDFAEVMSKVRTLVRQLDEQAAPYNVAAMDDIVANRIARPRMYAVLLGIFAGIGVVLAAIGIYGVMAYSVSQRTREIGIRMALGAQRSAVVGLVLHQSLVLTLVGIGIGIAGAAALTRYLEGLLFGLTPFDPPTFAAVAVMFAAVALVAAFVPARRATKVDPLVALRYE
jgi:putative ABC transport system permease protein